MNHSRSFHFAEALIGDLWQKDVLVDVSADGWITSVASSKAPPPNASRFNTVALPGMPNLHSHAFQRGFAGLTEFRMSGRDTFWTWREKMFQFVESMTPDRMYAIARQLYTEMRMAGYTWVGEFHYLHRQRHCESSTDPVELSEALLRAAQDVGIGICMIPVLYQRGNFDNAPLAGGQRQFHLSIDEFHQLFDDLESKRSPNMTLGMALHSLRAVDVRVGNELVASIRARFPNCPIHIHVAEQTKEIDDCLRIHERRSVEFLFDHFPVDPGWCLIHATHLSPSERKLITESQAVVGLCPTTEANLGDGIFPTLDFVAEGGRFGIGTDSHCSIDLREELRLLEYNQRLAHRQRAVLSSDSQSVGRFLYQSAAQGGSQALGIKSGRIEAGYRADMVLVDAEHPAIGGVEGDRLLDRLIFCNHGNPIVGSIVGGSLCERSTL